MESKGLDLLRTLLEQSQPDPSATREIPPLPPELEEFAQQAAERQGRHRVVNATGQQVDTSASDTVH